MSNAAQQSTTPQTTLPKFLTDNPSYKEAQKFMREAKAHDKVEYGWVWEYAKETWELRRKILQILDDKADSIIKYLGGGLGLLTLGVLAKVEDANAYLVAWMIPAIGCAIAAIFNAARVRMPRYVPSLPSVRAAVLQYAQKEKTEEKAKAGFLGQMDQACEGMKLESHEKARILTLADWCYVAAIVLLILPIGAALYAYRAALFAQ